MNLPFADALLHWYVCRQLSGPTEQYDPSIRGEIQRILLVLTTGLGDAILSTPAFSAVRKAFPHSEMRLFCRAAWAPLFLQDPNFTEVIPYRGKYRQFFSTLNKLRHYSPDLVVILHGNDPDIVPISFLSGSRFIIRVPTHGTRYRFLLSNRSRAQDASALPDVHYIENRLRVLDTLGIARDSSVPVVHLDQARRSAALSRLGRFLKNAPYWVLHGNAADPYKSWPMNHLRELVSVARQRFPDHRVILTGTRRERNILKTLADEFEGVHVVAGEYDIVGTAAILANAACVVAPDTGILHLAAAFDRPVVGLYAPTNANLVGPRTRSKSVIVIQKPQTCDPCLEKKCPYTPHHCMNQINVDEVLIALSRHLASA